MVNEHFTGGTMNNVNGTMDSFDGIMNNVGLTMYNAYKIICNQGTLNDVCGIMNIIRIIYGP